MTAAKKAAESPKAADTDAKKTPVADTKKGETVGLTKEESKVNSLNMGGGGDVVLRREVDEPDRYETDLPKGGDGKNPISPNNPVKKAII